MPTNIADRPAIPTAARHLEEPIAQITTTTATTVDLPLTLTRVPPAPPPQAQATTWRAFPTQQMPNFQPSWLAIQPLPMMYFPRLVGCCGRYLQWTRNRKGRPPHDPHCSVRTGSHAPQYVVDHRLHFTG